MSGTLLLPNSTTPAASRRSTASALRDGRLSLSSGAPHVVGRPATSYDSFTVMGTPWSGPGAFPSPSAASAARARLRAPSGSVTTMALSRGLYVSTRARYMSSSSRQPIFFLRTSAASCLAERKGRSSMGLSSCDESGGAQRALADELVDRPRDAQH